MRNPLSWLIVTGGFVACLGLEIVLGMTRFALETPLPWWVAQTAPPVLYAVLVFAAARPRCGLPLLGWTVLLWVVHLLVGMVAEALSGLFQPPGGPGIAWVFPPPPVPGVLWVPLLLVPLHDPLRGDSRGRRPAPAAREQGRPPVPRPAPVVPTSPIAGRPPADKPAAAPSARDLPAMPVTSMDVRYDAGRRPAPPAAAKAVEEAAPSGASQARAAKKEAAARPAPSHAQRLLDELLAKESSDEPVRVSFERVASQLPAEAFSVPLAEVAAALEEPGRLLVPRRLALAQLAEGIVRADWDVVAGQFPRSLLALDDAAISGRLPNGQLVLPLDEVVRQFPPELFLPAGPGPDVQAIESFPTPFQPVVSVDELQMPPAPVASPPEASAAPLPTSEPPVDPGAESLGSAEPEWAPLPEAIDVAPVPVDDGPEPGREAFEPGPATPVDVGPPEPVPTTAAAPVSPLAEEEMPAWPAEPISAAPASPRESPAATWLIEEASPAPPAAAEAGRTRGDVAAARALAAHLAPPGPVEVDARILDGVELFSVTAAGLGEDVASTAARLVLPLLADGRAPWPIDQVTLRGPRAALVLTPLGPLARGGPVLAAAVPAGRVLALLEIRCREAAAGYAARPPAAPAGAAASEERDEPDLLDVEPSTRIREVASSLGALGPVTASALRDAEADRALYLFLPPGSDVRMVGALANDLARALREAAATGPVWSVAVLRSGARRMVVRLPAAASGRSDTIVAAGETARPGLAYRQVEHAAAALGAL